MSNSNPIVTRRSKIYRTALANYECACKRRDHAEAAAYFARTDEAAKNLSVWEANCAKARAQLREIESMMR
jgi:hypothetical protein